MPAFPHVQAAQHPPRPSEEVKGASQRGGLARRNDAFIRRNDSASLNKTHPPVISHFLIKTLGHHFLLSGTAVRRPGADAARRRACAAPGRAPARSARGDNKDNARHSRSTRQRLRPAQGQVWPPLLKHGAGKKETPPHLLAFEPGHPPTMRVLPRTCGLNKTPKRWNRSSRRASRTLAGREGG
jgi:hypothetical protein